MESVVSFAVTKLADLLAQEVRFLQEVDDELRSFLHLLQWIQALLKDSDHSNKDDERSKLWVNQVRDLAHDAEDIIDDYVFKIHQPYHRSPLYCIYSLRKCVVVPSKLAILHDLGNNIVKVKGRAQEIYSNRNTFANQSIGATSSDQSLINEARIPLMMNWRQTAVAEEMDVLGFDVHAQALITMLFMGDVLYDTGDHLYNRRKVVSITGMGGVGKSALAKKIFSDPGIRRHFSCQAWIWVSQEYRAREVLETFAKDAIGMSKKKLKDLSQMELWREVYEYLEERKYLVILDDVWSKGVWDSIQSVLPDTKNGSRVLLTTRNVDVAWYADRHSPPYNLKLLGKEDSWKLFCRKAIPTKCSKDCPPQLRSIGRKMVEKCCGLPLAITVLGGLVLTKRQSVEEWRRLLKSANWQLRQGEEQISEILALSYHHLPFFMKPCFLYFSIFPKGSLISAKRLMRLWIAEGFIQPRDQETMEDVAEDYLEELVNWGLIQAVERHHHGGIKICQIHELLHDLSISLAQGINFIHIPNNDNQENILHKPRRLTFHDDKNSSFLARLKSTDFTSRLRTISFMDMKKRTSEMEKFFHNIKLLRVINIHGTGIKSLPNDIGQLVHLRYLGLRYTNLRTLPASIGRLTNLQTLDIKNSKHIPEIPCEVWQMQRNLRHLEGNGFSIKGLPSTESLPNLQTLSSIKAGTWLQNGLQKMTGLSKLGVHDVTGTYKEALLDCLGKLDNLNKLAWKASEDSTIPSSILSAAQRKNNLQVLYLSGPLEELPEGICMPAKLTKLTLESTKLQEDPLVRLGKLVNLQVLRLRNDAFVGREMVCLEKGFPQLEVLELNSLSTLEVWRIEDEAMPKLKELVIEACSLLVMLPQGLQKVTSLQELKVLDMSSYFCGELRNNDGDEWEKIKHIPSVIVHHDRSSRTAFRSNRSVLRCSCF